MSTFFVHLQIVPVDKIGNSIIRLPTACTITRATFYVSNGSYRPYRLSNKVALFAGNAATWQDTGTQVSECVHLVGVELQQPLIEITNFASWSNTGNFNAGDMLFLRYCDDSACKACYVQATLEFTTV